MYTNHCIGGLFQGDLSYKVTFACNLIRAGVTVLVGVGYHI